MIGILYFCFIGVLLEENDSGSNWEANLESIPKISDFDTDFGNVMSWLLSINETSIQSNIPSPANKDDLPNDDDTQNNKNSESPVNRDVFPENAENIPEHNSALHEDIEDVSRNNDDLPKNADYPINNTDLPKSIDDNHSSFFNMDETSMLNNIHLPANIDDMSNRDYAQNQTSDFEVNHDVWPKNSDNIREQNNDLHENDDGTQKNAEYSVNDTDLHKSKDDDSTQSRKRKKTQLPKFCVECNVPFKLVKEYEKHAREHHSDKKLFHCTTDECDRSFTNRDAFYKHRKIAHNMQKKRRTNAKDLFCRFCRKNFDNFHELGAHFKKLHPGEKKYKCEHCSRTFDIPSRKVQHVKDVHLQGSFKCTVCCKSFNREWHCQNHEKKCREKSKFVLENEKKYECNQCGKICNHRQYYMHMRHHKMYPPCPICGIGFAKHKGMDGLVNHTRRHHPEEFPDINIEELMENKGGKILSNKDEQDGGDELEFDVDNETHETSNNVGSLEDTRESLPEHDEDQPIAYRQMINDECFLGQNGNHLLENTEYFTENVVDPLANNDNPSSNNENVWVDSLGNMETTSDEEHHFLQWWRKWCDHWATHSCGKSSQMSSKPKPLCPECNDPFENISAFVKHVKQSHANKFLRCIVPGCGKKFKAPSTLNGNRKEIHLTGRNSGIIGENVFMCRLCGGDFRHFHQLSRHFIKVHPGEKKYKCQYCTETFEKKKLKIMHESDAHEDRYFECDVCRRTFTTRWYLNKHAQKCRDRQSREIAEHEWIQVCHLCRKKFIFPFDRSRYAKHMLRYKKYPHCPVCGIIFGMKKSDGSTIRELVYHIRWRHPDKFPKIDIQAVIENKEIVWKIEENVNEENDVELATVN